MKIIEVNDEIKQKLKISDLSSGFINSLQQCDFLAIVEHENKIIAASGIGGLFHVFTLQIEENFQNKGLGGKLMKAVFIEAKKRKYSFISGSRNPKNINAVKLHDFFELYPIFQINLGPKFIRDVVFINFNKKGKMIKKFLMIFNNLFMMTILIILVKIFKKLLFCRFLTYLPENFPNLSIWYSIKNFKKITK